MTMTNTRVGDFIITVPKSKHLTKRSQLLQDSLRDVSSDYSIVHEYPIVLDPQRLDFSFCAFDRKTEELVAHANLWPRILHDRKRNTDHSIALIGNVVTAPSHRNLGVMTQLFQHFDTKAQTLNLEALILWSDLAPFYQKLGFHSFGTEYRWLFFKDKFQVAPQNVEFIQVDPRTLSDAEIAHLLKIRYPAQVTLNRSCEEFKKLLMIPDMFLLIHRRDGIQAYCLIGKGVDLAGVIHEWGARDPQTLLGVLPFIFQETAWEQVMLLSPIDLEKGWIEVLQRHATSFEKHPMALGKSFSTSQLSELSDPCFIWGLDSI